jgi:hypothetical protein
VEEQGGVQRRAGSGGRGAEAARGAKEGCCNIQVIRNIDIKF